MRFVDTQTPSSNLSICTLALHNTAQVTRLVRDHLPTEARVMLVTQLCQNAIPGGWTEAVLGVMQSLLRMKLPLTHSTMASLVQTLETLSSSSSSSSSSSIPKSSANAEPAPILQPVKKKSKHTPSSISASPRKRSAGTATDLTSSLKFSAVLCTLVRQYPPDLVRPHVSLLRQALKRCQTFMAKPALRALNRLEHSTEPDM